MARKGVEPTLPIGQRRATEWVSESSKNFERVRRKINYRLERKRSIEDVLSEVRDTYRILSVLQKVIEGKAQILGQPKYK